MSDKQKNVLGEDFWLYDPRGVNDTTAVGGRMARDPPVVPLSFYHNNPNLTPSFYERAQRNGTVFMYAGRAQQSNIFQFN